MEDVLEVYHLAYVPKYPEVSMDESCKQLVGEVRAQIPCKPGQPARLDDEYVRNGVAQIFMEVEPLAGRRHVAVTERRTRKDWAKQIKQMLDERYFRWLLVFNRFERFRFFQATGFAGGT